MLVESNVPSELEQLLVVQTSKVSLPVSFESGSLNVAVRFGVCVPTVPASAGLTSAGELGPAFAVPFVIEPVASEAVAAAFPLGGAVSRIIGSLPGFV